MLQTIGKNVLETLHLRTDFRAEGVVYLRADKPLLAINAVCVDRPEKLQRRRQSEEALDELEVTISADESGDSPKGIQNPGENDRLYRAGRGDTVVHAYGFAEVIERLDGGWRLLFRRHRRRSYGEGARE